MTSPRYATQQRLLVGQRVESVEAAGKHLLITLSSGWVVHTHMRMTGSWHCYQSGAPWKRARSRAKLVLQAQERLAVCFDAPVVELLAPGAAQKVLQRLGPDVLSDEFDWQLFNKRWDDQPLSRPLGDALLDQRVVSGVGNIYRCEVLFLERLNPFDAVGSLNESQVVSLVQRAIRTMSSNLGASRGFSREFGAGSDQRWVYRRSGQPCRKCAGPVRSSPLGDPPRTVYWCPNCQAPRRLPVVDQGEP